MKKSTFLLVAVSFMIANATFGYTAYGANGDNSKMAQYLRGEISTDECVDSYGVPKNNNSSQKRGTVRGELRKNEIGGGYTYKDTTGRVVEYHERSSAHGGGYDVYSNE